MNFDHITHENDVLHFGTKGMRWGHRKDPRRVTSKKNRRGRKIAAGAVILAGGTATALVLRKHGGSPAKSLDKEMRDSVKFGSEMAFRAKDKYGNVILEFGTEYRPGM